MKAWLESLGNRFGEWVGATFRRYPPWATVIVLLLIVAAAFAVPLLLAWVVIAWLIGMIW